MEGQQVKSYEECVQECECRLAEFYGKNGPPRDRILDQLKHDRALNAFMLRVNGAWLAETLRESNIQLDLKCTRIVSYIDKGNAEFNRLDALIQNAEGRPTCPLEGEACEYDLSHDQRVDTCPLCGEEIRYNGISPYCPACGSEFF